MCSDENAQRVACDTRRRESASSSPPRVEMVCLHFFLHGNFQTRSRPKHAERESPDEILLSLSRSSENSFHEITLGFPALPSGLSMRKYASGFYVLLRDEFTRMKSLNDSILSVVSGSIKKCVLRERPPRENEPRRSMIHPPLWRHVNLHWRHGCNALSWLHRSVLTLTLNWRQSPCCTGTGARKLSTPSCPNFFAVHVSSRVVDGLIKISLMSTVGRRPSSFFLSVS